MSGQEYGESYKYNTYILNLFEPWGIFVNMELVGINFRKGNGTIYIKPAHGNYKEIDVGGKSTTEIIYQILIETVMQYPIRL